MARYSPQFFDIKQPLYVRKAFQGNGRMYLPGMYFDWRHHAIAPNRVRALFRASYIMHEKPGSLEDEVAEMDEAIEDVVVEDVIVEGTPVLTYSIDHAGGPYYNVVSSTGEIMTEKGLRRKEAQELADELNKTDVVGDSSD